MGHLILRVCNQASQETQVLIHRHGHPQSHAEAHVDKLDTPQSSGSSMDVESPTEPSSVADELNEADELSRIRELLRPPPMPGVANWGIPTESTERCDPTVDAKVAQFIALKKDQKNPKHFNDSLMSNRSFRNPHLYAKLVEFVDVDERVTNFPRNIWDPSDVKDEWYADRIAEHQKARSEQQSQNSAKRSHIDFTASKSHVPPTGPRNSGRQQGGKDRFQPYGFSQPSHGNGSHEGGQKKRERSRWG
ncbi:HCNGP-domain-containing protein [Neolentinus lepideus HHB14362 ss-1]|uniref:HCNGP-domain-containing protein n=1 Tax=Neolentinus lepideus HHB14362 ss-1 TaxID=1314782 RepID=A0A165NQ66_9AGAM|nr:HCNGP-domain-containing protein [Neolentinus lepideus HHB14362 ss-1]